MRKVSCPSKLKVCPARGPAVTVKRMGMTEFTDEEAEETVEVHHTGAKTLLKGFQAEGTMVGRNTVVTRTLNHAPDCFSMPGRELCCHRPGIRDRRGEAGLPSLPPDSRSQSETRILSTRTAGG